MRTCRHCQKEQPDEQFVTEHGTVCKACRLAQRRAAERARYEREALAREQPTTPLIVDRVRQALTDHGPLTAREVSELTGVTPLQAATSLTRLQTAGKVACVGRVSATDSADRRTLIKRWQLCDSTPPSKRPTGEAFRDTEHDQWLAAVRARQQYRQQQHREWRV